MMRGYFFFLYCNYHFLSETLKHNTFVQRTLKEGFSEGNRLSVRVFGRKHGYVFFSIITTIFHQRP